MGWIRNYLEFWLLARLMLTKEALARSVKEIAARVEWREGSMLRTQFESSFIALRKEQSMVQSLGVRAPRNLSEVVLRVLQTCVDRCYMVTRTTSWAG
jgi:hypothetical protein